MMKKILKTAVAAGLMASMLTMNVFAAGWTQGQGENSSRWWFDLDNGNYYAAESQAAPDWQWLDGNQDGVAECYAFDTEGWLYIGTQTPDGYQVNGDGAWVLEGVTQTRTAEAGDPSDTVNNAMEATRDVTADTSGADLTGDHDVLVVYYSRTNTTEQAANMIHQQLGGDIFEIVPLNPYPSSYSATTEQAQREINAGILPEIQTDVENFDDYEVVVVGYPKMEYPFSCVSCA